MAATKNCVNCLTKPALFWDLSVEIQHFHPHEWLELIDAGFCSQECYLRLWEARPRGMLNMGPWRPIMGKIECVPANDAPATGVTEEGK